MNFGSDEVYYDDESHQYFDKETGENFISVSTIIKLYSNPFDPEKIILNRVAKKEGIAPEVLAAKWEKIGEEARQKGQSVHNSLEKFILTKEINSNDSNQDIIQNFKNTIYPTLEGKLYTEIILCSKKYKLAGRTDIVHLWWDNIIDILDAKTNKKINTYSFKKRMLPPLSHLFDSTYIHYECQLSLYALMLEARGFCPKNLTLLWINPKTRQIEPMAVKYRRQEMIDMLTHYNADKK